MDASKKKKTKTLFSFNFFSISLFSLNNDDNFFTIFCFKSFIYIFFHHIFLNKVVISKEQNIDNYGYIGTWILRKYRKISVDILIKISVM